QPQAAQENDAHRHVVLGAPNGTVTLAASSGPYRFQPSPNRTYDHGQRTAHANEARSGHASGPDVEQVIVPQLRDAHGADRLLGAWRDGLRGVYANEVDRGNQDQVAKHGPGHHDRAGSEADNIADA